MKTRIIILLALLFFGSESSYACSIFCAAKKGEVLAAANEDWSDPFTKMWTKPATKDNYGVLFLGHSNYEPQVGINEHGLFFDFAVIPTADGKNMEGKLAYKGDLFTQMLFKCKNVSEALEFFQTYAYPSSEHQALIGDASGGSALLNQDAIIPTKTHYQISTNFNSCNIATGAYECKRYDILDEALSTADSISVPLFRKLLSRTHQEGDYPTQYSYIFDLKRQNIYLYSFHNYEDVIELNLSTELNHESYIKDLKDLFPLSFEEHYFRSHHSDSLKQGLLGIIKQKNVAEALDTYEDYVARKPETASYPFLLWDLGADMLKQAWLIDSAGIPFYYWWQPETCLDWQSNHPDLKKALKLFNYLENIPKEDPRQQIGAFEMKGLIYYVMGENKMASDYLKKTLEVAPPETGNYARAKFLLQHLKNDE